MVEIRLPKILEADNCAKYRIAPSIDNGQVSSIYISEETDINIVSAVKFSLGREIDFNIIGDDELSRKIAELFQACSISDSCPAADTASDIIDSSIIELIDSIISDALRHQASDIHMEPFEGSMSIRCRLDGVLQQKRTIKKENVPAVISRVKIMSGLDIAEKRRPQDGRIRFQFDNRTVDIRVSILPTDFGEKAVLRLLDKAALQLDIGKLGFDGDNLALLKEKIKLPNGIILITGPTGSGKTTTLYAALNYIKSPGINITTIEDPIEYNLEGINQTQIKPEINLTFASSLRAILRQDPNVIMVGEIRDRETLDNALRASLTGHLVFSTIHTNDSISTIARLTDLGADRHLLQSTLKLIVAQRLVRIICPHCKGDRPDSNERAAATALGLPHGTPLWQGLGCKNCLHIGYRGRTAIYEMLNFEETMGESILEMDSHRDILNKLKNKGMITLRDRGLRLIREGITTPSEVLRETC